MSLTRSMTAAIAALGSFAEAAVVSAREVYDFGYTLTERTRGRIIPTRRAGRCNAAALKRASKKRRNIRRFGGAA